MNVGKPDASTLQIYVEGSSASPPTLRIAGNAGAPDNSGNPSEDEFSATIYAPQSYVELAGDSYMTGAVVGKKVTVGANFRLRYSDTAQGVAAQYPFASIRRWTECTSAPPNASPSSGC